MEEEVNGLLVETVPLYPRLDSVDIALRQTFSDGSIKL